MTRWLGAFAAAGLLAVIGWAGLETMIGATSGAEFCGQCHSMQPMVAAYRKDVHGSGNRWGVETACTDCHLPHDGPISTLIAKARLGAHDAWVELTRDTAKIDWQARRSDRETYVFDSGCLHCHTRLEQATNANPRALVAHKPYFLGQIKKRCVSCHEFVGHHDLASHLPGPTD